VLHTITTIRESLAFYHSIISSTAPVFDYLVAQAVKEYFMLGGPGSERIFNAITAA